MSKLFNYTATGANSLKNWARAAPTKLYFEKYFRFWPFYIMFMNYIKNMGWIASLVFTESGKYYTIAKDFGQFRIETIDIDYQALEIATQPTDNTKRLKFRGLYTWIFNSSDELAQDFLAEESNNNHRSRPLAWKLLTTEILRGMKQGTCRAQNMIHTLSLEKFDNNIKSLVKYLIVNRKILESC